VRRLGFSVVVLVGMVSCTGANPAYVQLGFGFGGGGMSGRGGAGGRGGGGTAAGGAGGGGASAETDAGPSSDGGTAPDGTFETQGADASADLVKDLNPPLPEVTAEVPVDLGPPASMLALGLEAYWKLDEATGRMVKDAAKGNNGTAVDDAAWMPGGPTLLGRTNASCISLDGDGDYINFTVASLPAIDAAKTISLWLKTTDTTATMHNALALVNPTMKNGSATGQGVQLGVYAGKVAMWQYSLDAPILAAPEAILNAWVHVAYTYDGTRHRLFRNGLEVGTTLVAAQKGPVTSARVGVYDQLFEFYKGQVDEVRVWSRVLTDAEIAGLARGD
jgi:hypothetical protein